jgi:aminotransferase
MNSFDFAMALLQEARVAVVPGTGFSEYGEGFIRISYAASMEMLITAFDRIEFFMHSILNKKAVQEDGVSNKIS